VATQWNDQEESELQGLPLLTQIVYLRCFRRFMDYDTGIVGIARKIGYQMMAETCETVPDKGSRLQYTKPTRNELRAAVRQLIRRGLIILISKRLEQPVYKLPLATTNHAPPTPTLENFEQSEEVGGFYSQEERQRNDKGGLQAEQQGERQSKPNVSPLFIITSEVMNDKGSNKKNDKRQPAMNDIHQGSVLPYLTIPVQITISEVESIQIPDKASEWCEFFVNHVRYQFHEVKTVPVMTMFRTWCEVKLSLAEAVVAIEAAEQNLGKRPDKPAYYKLFVEEAVKNRNAKLNSQGAPHVKTNKRATAEELAIEQLGGNRVYEHED